VDHVLFNLGHGWRFVAAGTGWGLMFSDQSWKVPQAIPLLAGNVHRRTEKSRLRQAKTSDCDQKLHVDLCRAKREKPDETYASHLDTLHVA
jgi:hypothetical protein